MRAASLREVSFGKSRVSRFGIGLVALLLLTSVFGAGAYGSAGPHLEVTMSSTPVPNGYMHTYLSDPLFRDASGKLHLGACVMGPHDGFYTSSTNSGQTWLPPINITREYTATKGGTIYINNDTGKGLYMGFFNVSGYDLNYTANGGASWTTGAYRFIPGSTGGLTSYLYPLGSAYDGKNTVYAVTWSSRYHGGNGKAGLSKSIDLGTTWSSITGVPNTNTLFLESNDQYAMDAMDLVIDRDGTLYVLYMAYDVNNKWNLKAYNSATGAREIVQPDLGYTRFGATAVTAWIGPDGKTVHAVFVKQTATDESHTLFYTQRDASGVWATPSALGSDGISRRPTHASSTLDANVNAYVIWSNYDGTRYRMFSSVLPDGSATWGPVTEVISTTPGVNASNPWVRAVEPGLVEVVYSKVVGTVRSAEYSQLRLVSGTPADQTPPVITPVVSGTLGQNDWYTSDVTVLWEVDDPESPISSIIGGEPQTLVVDTTGTSYTCEATSSGGTASVTASVKRDATPPVVQIIGPAHGSDVYLGSTVVADWSASDATSGLSSVVANVPSGEALETGVVGTHSVTVTATANAGNKATVTSSYNVRYVFGGVLPPVQPDGSGVHKLGSTIPVKFTLADGLGQAVDMAQAKLYLAKVESGQVGPELDATPSGKSSDGNSIRYSTDAKLYIYNLSTKPLATGQWRLRIRLDDGSDRYADITLR